MYDSTLSYNYTSRFTRKLTVLTLRTCIDPDQPKHAAQANTDRHFSPPMDFQFQESLLYTYIYPETECIGPD